MDNLSAIRLFLEIVKSGSFSEAARHIGLAPSSVTRQINALEEELGVRLLQRTTRQVSPTDAGRIYFNRALLAVAEIDDMNRTVMELDASVRGILKVSAPLNIGQDHITPRLEKFLEQYPDLSLELELSDKVADLVHDGFDAAIRVSVQLPDSSLIARRLHQVKRFVCVSPAYLEKHGKPRHPQDLKDHQCLAYGVSAENHIWSQLAKNWHFVTPGGELDIPVSGRFRPNSSGAVLEAALCGLGIAILPLWQSSKYLESGRLVRLFDSKDVRFVAPDYDIYIVYPSNRHLSPKVRAFSDFMADSFKLKLGE
ncbi:MAG: LysR family transcriptional regulator [Sneathiella sp.]|nr:LysR family transcriptional regulator [Sneathiella sp.]